MTRRKTVKAFSLVELMIVLTILGLLMAFAAPSVLTLGSTSLSVSGQQLAGKLHSARMEAISKNTHTRFVVVRHWPGKPEAADRRFCVQIWDHETKAFVQSSKWDQLPEGLLIESSLPEYLYEAAYALEDPLTVCVSTPNETQEIDVDGEIVEATVLEFKANGQVRTPESMSARNYALVVVAEYTRDNHTGQSHAPSRPSSASPSGFRSPSGSRASAFRRAHRSGKRIPPGNDSHVYRKRVVFAVNAGGNALHDFVSDSRFSGGTTTRHDQPVAGTKDDALFQTARSGIDGGFSFRVPLANGEYGVRLMFSESEWNAPGRREFHVDIEGRRVIQNLDVFKRAGSNTAYSDAHRVTVTDGRLDIDFINGSAGVCMVNAIQVTGRIEEISLSPRTRKHTTTGNPRSRTDRSASTASLSTFTEATPPKNWTQLNIDVLTGRMEVLRP